MSVMQAPRDAYRAHVAATLSAGRALLLREKALAALVRSLYEL